MNAPAAQPGLRDRESLALAAEDGSAAPTSV